MKRYIRSAVRPWKTKFTVHWLSPEGEDCLLGGANSLSAAGDIEKDQAQELFENPFETNKRKFLFLSNMYIWDETTQSVVEDYEADEYVDNLMSELDSRRHGRENW